MADVVEINDLRSLSGQRLLWESLLAETPGVSFFNTIDWLETYWRHFGQAQKMRVLVVRSADRPVGILPLCVRRRQHRLGALRVLTYPLDNWSAFYGPIGKNRTATLLSALRHVANMPRDWDQIDLPWTAHTGWDGGRTHQALAQVGFAPQVQPYATTSVIHLNECTDWQAYLMQLPKKVRHELRRRLRRIEEHGDVRLIRHRPASRREGDGDPRWDLYDACESIASESWQAKSTSGNTLSHEKYACFYRDAHTAAARLGMVDQAVLEVAGRPIAFWCGYHMAGQVVGLRMGYRSDSLVEGAGTALLAKLIEDSIVRGDRTFDLGVGSEKYKARFRTHQIESHRITHTPTVAWRPQLVRASRWLKQRLPLPKLARPRVEHA